MALRSQVISPFDTRTKLISEENSEGVGIHKSHAKWFRDVGIGLNSSAQFVSVPVSSASAGKDGQVAVDANFFYIYITNQWKRAALSTF